MGGCRKFNSLQVRVDSPLNVDQGQGYITMKTSSSPDCLSPHPLGSMQTHLVIECSEVLKLTAFTFLSFGEVGIYSKTRY